MLIAPHRIMRGGPVLRAAAIAAVCFAVALTLAACGGGGEGTGAVDEAALEREAEQEADIEALNQILGRQRAAVDAFDRTIPQMRGPARALAVRLRTQEQEHSVAILQELRKLEGAEEIERETIESGPLPSEADRLRFLYEVESATIEDELSAIGRLNSGSARVLLAATVANQAQHLVLLRRALGAPAGEWVPAPFENGTTAAP